MTQSNQNDHNCSKYWRCKPGTYPNQGLHGGVTEITKTAHLMNQVTDELVGTMTSVCAVTEENTASTAEMNAGSLEVGQGIENIANVSEENSAALAQVSAAAGQMSAQVIQYTASAQAMKEMALNLQDFVGRFNL